MPHDVQYALRQYLVLSGFAGVCFVISWLLSDPAFLVVIKTVFAPIYLLATTGLDAHFRRADAAPWPLWQKVEYAIARAALFVAFIIVMCIRPDQSARDVAKSALATAIAIGAVEVIFALRNRRSKGA
ncbi:MULTISPECIES: hypothetical protein [Ensifer]|jgi:hypothetical protein|uniref:Uncharacterized protein n=1 Tax=Ensifer canadensis TaxID=555315 RepID=A0AAW4FFI9_9HYPH|nr:MULTISPECIES: hypothetical protein [Ensifer]MDP9628933.1 hypothetical protein [Ensifer adhaerens]KQU98528.1 hypothetical protein ASD00_02525 [Ensifer sp. Root31]KQW63288.1 hypothetical protein ASD02_04160 [Ensifer sp. Root1252]KQW85302.1 hypothetical protein ASD03_06360 [Ensifer sp. Root127]KQY75694.1 hypothetical protein ASD52_24605 [Ensifer sp. Root142]